MRARIRRLMRARAPGLVVLGAFVLTRLACAIAGMGFEDDHLGTFWQFLDPRLLRTDLAASLWSLHSQPPLFNLFLGCVLKLAPGVASGVFAGTFLVAGLVLTLATYGLMVGLGVPRWPSCVLTVLFAISPGVLLYERFLLYTLPVATLLMVAGWFLHRHLTSGRVAPAVGYVSAIAMAALTRSALHPVWFLLAAVLFVWATPLRWRRALVVVAVPTMLVLGWTVKNQVQFGVTGTSSWTGMNLARLAVMPLDPEVRERAITDGRLSEVSRVPPFSPSTAYPARYRTRCEGAPPALRDPVKSTGAPNFNHCSIPGISAAYRRDALTAMRAYPGTYARSVLTGVYYFFRPVGESPFLAGNRARIAPLEAAYGIVHRGLPMRPMPPAPVRMGESIGWYVANLGRTGLVPLAGYALIPGLLVVLLVRTRRMGPSARGIVLAYLLGTAAWITLVGTAVEVGENNRFRLLADGLVLVSLVAAASGTRRTGPTPGPPPASVGDGVEDELHQDRPEHQ